MGLCERTDFVTFLRMSSSAIEWLTITVCISVALLNEECSAYVIYQVQYWTLLCPSVRELLCILNYFSFPTLSFLSFYFIVLITVILTRTKILFSFCSITYYLSCIISSPSLYHDIHRYNSADHFNKHSWYVSFSGRQVRYGHCIVHSLRCVDWLQI